MPLCVMLTSVVEHFSEGRDLIVHIISNDATAQDREKVRESIAMVRPDLEHVELHWYAIDASVLEKLPLKAVHLSRDTYARLFAPYLLPATCERAIYLDCDLVVMADIAELFDSTANDGTVLHAVHDVDCPYVSSEGGVFDYEKRGIPPDTRIFNGGVLVMDLKSWRERDLTSPMLEYAERYGSQIHWADQGVMNAFLHHDWTPLDPRWNQLTGILHEDKWLANGYSRQEWLRTKNDPYIVHFSGPYKPWGARRRYISRRIFFYRQLQKTVFRNTVPRYPYLEFLLGCRIYYHLWLTSFRLFPKGIRG